MAINILNNFLDNFLDWSSAKVLQIIEITLLALKARQEKSTPTQNKSYRYLPFPKIYLILKRRERYRKTNTLLLLLQLGCVSEISLRPDDFFDFFVFFCSFLRSRSGIDFWALGAQRFVCRCTLYEKIIFSFHHCLQTNIQLLTRSRRARISKWRSFDLPI